MPRHLRIAEPCAEPWDSMSGSEERKHCARCDKHVVALAEMTPEEADQLIASAPPHSLCLRIEHDDEGFIFFRDKPTAPPGPRPMLKLAMSASLLVAACSKPEAPPPEPEPAKIEATNPQLPQETSPKSAEIKPVPPEELAKDGARGERATTTKAVPLNKPRRVTTGCACQMNDPLCSCL